MAKISIVTGIYGSGKSEFTVQYALKLSNSCKVFIADLDIVNVYFRSRERSKLLEQHGVTILGNVLGNNVNNDVPHLSANFYEALKDENSHLIIDLAGSEAGLKMIGAFIEELVERNNGEYEFLFVYNMFRGLNDRQKIIDWIEYVNMISDLKLTGVVNNSHLMEYTTINDIQESQKILEESCDLNIKYTMVDKSIFQEKSGLKNVFIMPDIYLKKEWDRKE